MRFEIAETQSDKGFRIKVHEGREVKSFFLGRRGTIQVGPVDSE